MSEILGRIHVLVARRGVLISEHGYDELVADAILVTDVYEGVRDASPAVVVTAYRPDPDRWTEDLLRRKD